VFHVGPQRDISIFDGLDVRLTPVEAADYVVCSGLFDDTKETPDDYRDLMATIRGRGLFMVCANPDLVVERGDERVYCAGSDCRPLRRHGGRRALCGKTSPSDL